MRKLNPVFKLVLVLFLIGTIESKAQSLSTGTSMIEDYYRREQLLGNINLNFSFVSYPLFPVEAFNQENPYDPDNAFANSRSIIKNDSLELDDGKYILKRLPILWKQQTNYHHPEGINDGSMIPARGYQTLISTGFYFKYDHLSIKLQPEFVYAANLEYEGFPLTRKEQAWADRRWYEYYYYYLNYIDAPERFGENSYEKVFWGQSSIRLTFNSISLGLSTENLWWGPGMRNSLIMTNSAPGFTHFTFNTVKPIETIIGSFEGQVIAGWLKSSGFMPPGSNPPQLDWEKYYSPKLDGGRYINGMILSYQPKWVPGLFVGLIRSFQVYHKDMGEEFIDYLPIFSSFGMDAGGGDYEVNMKRRDAYNSIFFRFVWPESQVEIYGEYGRSDYFWNGRDLFIQLDHSSAYNLGFRKLIPLNNVKKEYLQTRLEITQLAKNANTSIRPGGGWGADLVVRDGYTHNGQFIGPGIGAGSNLQTLEISWIRSLKQIGLRFERHVHNEDFFFAAIKDIRSHWVDMSSSLMGNWDYKNFLFMLELKAVVSINYQWEYDFPWPGEEYWTPGINIYNYHGQLSVIYRF